MSVVEYAIKGVAAGIGLASESIKAKKAKKQRASESDITTPSSSDSTPSSDLNENFPLAAGIPTLAVEQQPPRKDNDERNWELDAAQDDIAPPGYDQPSQLSLQQSTIPSGVVTPENETAQEKEKRTLFLKKIITRFLSRYPAPHYPFNMPLTNRLPLPVILPQRRPKNRARGFIRAYAPLLENCDISQTTFLDFLSTFNEATQANPWINAINFAGLAAHGVAPGVAVAVQVAIAVTIKAAKEIHSRQRTNSFLDAMNNEFFRPRGLYCLVLTWNPESSNATDTVDLTSIISKSINPSTGQSQTRNKFHTSSGNSYGDFEFPAAAPLVFPVLDEIDSQDEQKTMEKMKRKGEFVSEYFDRRARAQWAAEHPDSVLSNGPKEKFASRYADPNHPASSGNPWSLLTGGHFNPPTLNDLRKPRLVDRGGGLGGRGRGPGGVQNLISTRTGILGRERQGESQTQSFRSEQRQQLCDTRGLNRLGEFEVANPLAQGLKKILGYVSTTFL
ncbi:FAD binding domain protein [Rutstroemia sp. NJR-2017a BVV2]|nr:FAD binding domain protein [Rutstroemia sp. NJR-2017a BVV2]